MAGATFLSSFDKLDFSKQGFNRYSEYQIWISENTINANAEGLTGVQKNNPLDDALVKDRSHRWRKESDQSEEN